ncbi:YwqG family protein [Arenimonas sp. MALMAid1274]|uniref:YwqG family protein n=1 Tax=Arenimonas sp. MALMAid1274 TaxID=3411630 RepID=UPI003BA18FCF
MAWMVGLGIVLAIAVAGGAWLLRGKPATAAEAPAAKPAKPGKAMSAQHLRAFMAPYEERLAATARPVRPLSLEALPDDALTVSKVGGRAWWPDGEPAPRDAAGAPLVLLAQINFAELPPTPGYPAEGLVQFFITDNDHYGANFDGELDEAALSAQRNFRVVYWPDLSRKAQALPLRDTQYLPHEPGKPRRLRFGSGQETLSSSDWRFDGLLGGNAYAQAEKYADQHGISADELIYELSLERGGGGSKVGGYPFFTQTDPRSRGDWELLLQLDSDDEMMWGDAGVGGFFIRPEDLARADFSRVIYTWDCY